MYALDKRIQSKCKFSDVRLVAWKLAKFLMWFFKPQVRFSFNFAIPISVMTHDSLKFSNWNIVCFGQKEPINVPFFQLGCSNETSPNSSCHYSNHKVRVYSNFTSLFSAMKYNSTVFFLAQASYTLDKNSSSKWNFWTFEWLGENSPNSSCHIWNQKSVFL